MARRLTKQQKQILAGTHASHWDELPSYVQSQLEVLNDYETLWMDVSRYLCDFAVSMSCLVV